MTMTETPGPPSYNEAILQRKLSELEIGERSTIDNNSDDIIELSSPSTEESVITEDQRKKEDVFVNEQQATQNDTRPITVGRVLLIGLLLVVSPWCACKMMKSTPQHNRNVQGCSRTRGRSGCCGGSVDPMERQQQRGERRIARLERRIERKTEKMDRKEARDKLCNRKRQKYERKIHRWENKIEQRQNMINLTCKSNNVYSPHNRAVKC